MLTELTIENFALIDRVRLSFGAGLNLLTGETGAGKSILLDALGMALGERTSAEAVRHGAERARVEAVFAPDPANAAVKEALDAAGVEGDDSGLVILSREISAAGKSAVRINGRAATVGMLKSLGDALVDIHGQHEHQSLLSVDRHADILDAWGGLEIADRKSAVASAAAAWQGARHELETLQRDARERERTLDLLGFQAREIDAGAPAAGEDERLETERIRLASAERLREATATAYGALAGGSDEEDDGLGRSGLRARRGADAGGAVEALSTAVSALADAARADDGLMPLLESLRGALFTAEDAARDIRTYRDEIDASPERLEEIENRLDTLRTLKRKYGATLDEVIRYRMEIGERLSTLENVETRMGELEESVRRAEQQLAHACALLTEARHSAARPFAEAIQAELAELAMPAARFTVLIEPRTPGARGADHVEFLISANPGEPLRPLARIASGGEISRIMLAMKSVLAKTYSVPTLIFDEVDTGIGGRTGAVLAEKLAALSEDVQVLCITHLPQIAARGGTHLYIEKQTDEGRTTVSVVPLRGDDRVREIARMLGGTRVTDTVLQHAREMLNGAAGGAE